MPLFAAVAWAGGVAACLMLGNLAGRALRTRASDRTLHKLELGTPVLLAVVAVLGLG